MVAVNDSGLIQHLQLFHIWMFKEAILAWTQTPSFRGIMYFSSKFFSLKLSYAISPSAMNITISLPNDFLCFVSLYLFNIYRFHEKMPEVS